jgi:hypothetical protein
MMDNFAQILQQLLMVENESLTRIHFEGVAPFMVHVNFYIPLFEFEIDVDALEKWLNMIEGY